MATRLVPLLLVFLASGCDGTSLNVLTTPPEVGTSCPIPSTPDAAKTDAEMTDSASGDDGSDGASQKGPHGGTWPTYAHDFKRSSRGDGAGQIASPEIAWTLPMGGVLAPGQVQVADLTGDGRPDTIAVTGGRVTATAADGTTLWQGALVGARDVLGVWNLDGVGGPEVVVYASSGVLVLAGSDGHELTTLPAPEPAVASFVPEGPTGGILVVGQTNSQLAGYDFRQGTHVSTAVWTVTNEDPSGVLVGDVDGNGTLDLVHPLNAGFEVRDPLTGAVLYSANPIGPAAYVYVAQLANCDANPGLDIVAVDTSYSASPSAGIYVLGVSHGALNVLWSSAVVSQVALSNTDFETVLGAVADLNGDGHSEVMYSRWDGTTQAWTTYIADGATGATDAAIPGQFLQAVADLDGSGKAAVVVRSNPAADQTPLRTVVSAYDYAGPGAAPVARPWTIAKAHVMSLLNSQYSPVVADFDPGPGLELLIGADEAQRQADSALAVVHGDGSIAATYSVPVGVTPSVLWTGKGLTSTTSVGDVLTFGSDGHAHALSGNLQQTVSFTAGSYENWLGVYGLDTSRTIAAMATSNRDLLWLDGTHLHADGTPYQPAHFPGVVDTSALASLHDPIDPVTYLAGPSPTLVAFEQGETNVTMVGLDTSGVEIWRTPLAAGTRTFIPGAYALDLTGDGFPDPIVTLFNVNSLESQAIFDGTTGVLVRSTPLASIVTNGVMSTTGSLVDVNGDGVPDLVAPVDFVGEAAINLSANPMTALWTVLGTAVAPTTYAGTIGAAAVDSQGTSLLRFNGNLGSGAYMRLSLAGNVLASQDQGLINADGTDQNGVAFVQRTPGASQFDLVSAGMNGAALGRVRRIAGDTLATVWTEYVSGGVVSQSAPSQVFALHDPIAFDADGDGADEVIFGSDDGLLYALHASDGSLAFSLNLGAPVAHVIAADVDLDPELELLASLADGRLVAIDGAGHYSAVRDSAPDAGGAHASDAGTDTGSLGTDAGMNAEMDSGPGCVSERVEGYVPVHTSCACRAGADADPSSGAALVALGALSAMVVRRTRRRVCR